MRMDELPPEREVTDALRLLDRSSTPSPSDVRRLVRRVVANAGPLLDQRRGGGVQWCEYPAAWARTLIPLGIAAALAAASFILWARGAHLPISETAVASARYARSAETADMAPQQMLDALVAPVEQGVLPSPARPRTRDAR